MASVTKYPQTTFQFEDENGDVPWNNPDNVKLEDNIWAEILLEPGYKSFVLQTTNYGFTIPTGSTIDGIIVTLLRREASDSNSVLDVSAKIMKGGNPVGYEKANQDYWGNDIGLFGRDTIFYGIGLTDKWEVSWTAEDINNLGFGVQFIVNSNTQVLAEVEYIKITVYYTPVVLPVGCSPLQLMVGN
jgi:hypothetical protein